uniref:Cytochrome P450 6a2 n=1 Tax=Lygus hesperus TaxID=30085 RepID=A0A146M9X5_LYGHE
MESAVQFLLSSVRDNLIVTFLCVLSVYVVVKYGYGPFNFWKNLGVPQVDVQYPFIGNLMYSLKMAPHEATTLAYKAFPNERFVGTYTFQKPVLMVRDPELVEAVLIKDFSTLSDRGNSDDPNSGKLAKHLLNLKEEHWKIMRNKLTPTFTSGKLKGMHSQLVECAESLMTLMKELEDGRSFEVRDIVSRLTMDVIASCAFGLSIDTINHPESEFRNMGLTIFKPTAKGKLLFTLRVLPRPLLKIARKLMSNSVNFEKFFVGVVDSTLEHRKQNNIVRADFLHLMNEIRQKEQEMIAKKELDGDGPYLFDHASLVSNAFVFFLAGFETTASTMSYCMYELAMNQDVQEKLYEEVATVLKKHDGEPSYNAMQEMNYLEQVISETLRMHPPATSVSRKVTKDYRVPGSDVVLPPGVNVFVPIYALHHDPQHFPEPEKFVPERFDEGKDAISKGTYAPFGDGPRICIGSRFAKLEIKVAMAMMLQRYKIVPCEKTESPLKYDPNSFLLVPKGGIWLAIQPRNKV